MRVAKGALGSESQLGPALNDPWEGSDRTWMVGRLPSPGIQFTTPNTRPRPAVGDALRNGTASRLAGL